MERVIAATSAGKDSTLALHELRAQGACEVATLLTTVAAGSGRINMHGVRRELLRAHAAALGLPLQEVLVPEGGTNAAYEEAMVAALTPWRERGVRRVLHGDIFLKDLRAWREHNLATLGMEGIFPLWGRDTRELAETFLDLGYRAIVVCVDAGVLPRELVGRPFDRAFLAELPAGADPCGENGEFHTFVFDGLAFSRPVAFRPGEIRQQGRFVLQDLLPG